MKEITDLSKKQEVAIVELLSCPSVRMEEVRQEDISLPGQRPAKQARSTTLQGR